MATKTVVSLVDDLTGEEGENVTTVEFGLDGVTYEIDLDDKNAAELRDTLAVYVENGQRVGGRIKRGRGVSAPSNGAGGDRKRSQQIRAWAQEHGYTLADRGRVPTHIVEAYDKAQRGRAA